MLGLAVYMWFVFPCSQAPVAHSDLVWMYLPNRLNFHSSVNLPASRWQWTSCKSAFFIILFCLKHFIAPKLSLSLLILFFCTPVTHFTITLKNQCLTISIIKRLDFYKTVPWGMVKFNALVTVFTADIQEVATERSRAYTLNAVYAIQSWPTVSSFPLSAHFSAC